MKSYTDLEQSKKLAEILPLESADMTLPFRHILKDEYIPSPAISRNYIEVHNEMIKLPGMDNEEVCKLIQPVWSLAALISVLPYPSLLKTFSGWRCDSYNKEGTSCILGVPADNPVDACYEMILKLH